MLNVLRKAQESDNLAGGISTMNFLGSPPKTGGKLAAAETPSTNLNVTISPDIVSIPPETQLARMPPLANQSGAMPSLRVPSVLRNETVPLVQKSPSVLSGTQDALPKAGENVPSVVEDKPKYSLSVLPRGMEKTTPLNMPDRLVFGMDGENLESVAKNWSITRTPVFQMVQDSPIVKRSRITNRIGQVVNPKGVNVGVARLRIF